MSAVDDYLRRLSRGLKGLPRAERSRLVGEIASHLAERGEPALAGLGAPELLARSFAEDYRAARGAILGRAAGQTAGRTARIVRGAALFAVIGPGAVALYLLACVFGWLAYAKLQEPQLGYVRAWRTVNGLWNFGVSKIETPLPARAVEAGDGAVVIVCLAIGAVALAAASFLLVTSVRTLLVRPIFDAYRQARLGSFDAG